jgi:hypothetical protein
MADHDIHLHKKPCYDFMYVTVESEAVCNGSRIRPDTLLH